MSEKKYAIRFGLGAIKAVGFGMMDMAVAERKNSNKFSDIYDFVTRMDAKSINKKSIEALAKSGSFDCVAKNRRQIFESFDVLSAFAHQKKNEALSSQMNMFGELLGDANSKPELKKFEDWSKEERLQKEFEAFGFFLNEHPLDDHLQGLRKRGIIFSDKIEKDELEDNFIIKMAGVIAASKHRSGSRGRFAYLTISDPFGIFEAMIFDEAIITNARDLLVDGSSVVIECLVKKDDGGVRILVREVFSLNDFMKDIKPAKEPFEDIKKQPQRQFKKNFEDGFGSNNSSAKTNFEKREGNFAKKSEDSAANSENFYKQRLERLEVKKIFSQVEIFVKEREPILSVKSALSRLVAPNSFAKKTKVVFMIEVQNKKAKIELPEGYLLDESDLARLRAIDKVDKITAN